MQLSDSAVQFDRGIAQHLHVLPVIQGYPPMNPVGQETLPEIMELAS